MPVSSKAKFKYVGIIQRLADKKAIYLVTNAQPAERTAHISHQGNHNMETCEFAPLPTPMRAVDAYKYAKEKLDWDLDNPPWTQKRATNGNRVELTPISTHPPTTRTSAMDLIQTAQLNLAEAIGRRDDLQLQLSNVETEIKLLEAIVSAIPKTTTKAVRITVPTKSKSKPIEHVDAGHA